MHKKILHGLDGSAGSFRALEEAISLAQSSGAELHCISIEEVPRYAETVGETVEEQAVAVGKYTADVAQARQMASSRGITITTHVFVGHEVKTIIEFIRQNGFDLLVIGFMGHSALYDRVMGSTCQSLVRLAPCSVVIVK
jgi:nucleotide-binding universal stress UspA family protein